ncbi:MAG: hypothetical protein QW515_05910 [Thermoplasmatales archaeon]
MPYPSNEYWKSLEDVLIQYTRHNDNEFDYIDHIAYRKDIIADRIRYIGKESNNLDESMIMGIDDNSYIEYENLKEFYDWILKLKPKDVRDKGISRGALWDVKERIRKGKALNSKTKVVKMLVESHKFRKN